MAGSTISSRSAPRRPSTSSGAAAGPTAHGYEIELKRGTKDGGVDLFAIQASGIFGKQRYLLQAKRWSHAVGVELVRELLFLHSHHRVTKSCLATTSRFTKGAWELLDDYRWQLELKDYEALQEWVGVVDSLQRHNE